MHTHRLAAGLVVTGVVAVGLVGTGVGVAAAAPTGSVLRPGDRLTANDAIYSGQGDELRMNPDGNAVYYLDGVARWASNTSVPNSYLQMQADGNLVVYSPGGRALWSTGTNGTGADAFSLQTYQCDTSLTFAHDGTDGTSGSGYTVQTQVFERGSGGGAVCGYYHLVMQTDGNLVLYSLNASPGHPYDGGFNHAIWSAGTAGHPGARFVQQRDGNLVVYAVSGQALWSSQTFAAPGPDDLALLVQGDGNAVLYDVPAGRTVGTAEWSTGTAGRN